MLVWVIRSRQSPRDWMMVLMVNLLLLLFVDYVGKLAIFVMLMVVTRGVVYLNLIQTVRGYG